MALFRSLFRALAEPQFAAASEPRDGLRATVQGTNDYIARTHGSANMFATVFFAVLDPTTGVVEYVNAGHELPAVLGADGAVRARLAPTGPAVGLMAELPFGVARECIGRGEMLVAYTDGVVDARNPAEEPYGEERLMALLVDGGPTAQGLIERVDSALGSFIADAAQFDDVAMLAARRIP
jgi:sigma-B regulation protein RsbU (phosphoserine phosphatase)